MCAYVYKQRHTLIKVYMFKHIGFRMFVWAFVFQKAKIVLVAFWEHSRISKITLWGGVENGNHHMRRCFVGDLFLVMKSCTLPHLL